MFTPTTYSSREHLLEAGRLRDAHELEAHGYTHEATRRLLWYYGMRESSGGRSTLGSANRKRYRRSPAAFVHSKEPGHMR